MGCLSGRLLPCVCLLLLGLCVGSAAAQTLRSSRVPVDLVASSVMSSLPVWVDDVLIPGLGRWPAARAEYRIKGDGMDFVVWCVFAELPAPAAASGWNLRLSAVPALGQGLYLAGREAAGENLVWLPRLYGPHPRTGQRYWYVFAFPDAGPDLPGRVAAFVAAHQDLQTRNTRRPDAPAAGSPSLAGFFPPLLGQWR